MYITHETLLKEFRFAVTEIREIKIGFKAKEIGTHSVISVSVMATFYKMYPYY